MSTKVTIAVPSNRGIQPQTMQCLLELVAKDYDFHILVAEEGYTIAENRNWICVQALNNKSDWLLMIDDDMTFEPDLLDRLIAHDKDIIGVPFHPRCDDMRVMDKVHHKRLEEKTELFETEAIGTGIILIRTDVLYKIKRPWFEFTYHENGCVKQGEDWNFCEKARKKFNIYLDPTIEVGHVGERIIN